MEENLYALLSGALGVPVAWGSPGQSTPPPYVVLFHISGRDEIVTTGRSGFIWGRVQIDCYDRTFDGAMALRRQLTATLSGYSGTLIMSAQQLSTRSTVEAIGGDLIQRHSLDFAVLYRE